MPKQPSFIDNIESQREYVAAVQNGYGYTRHGNMAHYFFAKDQVEPSVREELPSAPFYVFSFTGCTMASYDAKRHAAPIITPMAVASDWVSRVPKG